MNKQLVTLALTLTAALLAAPALAQAPAADPAPASGVYAVNEISATGTVEAIDYAKRLVTIKGEGGRVETFEVDAAAKNLDQVKVGDVIVLLYKESLVWELNKPGAGVQGVEAVGAVGTAKKGEMPGAVAGRQVTATVTITAIDAKAPTVTIKGPAGNERTIKVKDPKKLAGVKVGDTLDITYTEAVAISVEKAPAKK